MLDDYNTVQFQWLFKWASLDKRNNLDELINVPTKGEER